MPAWKGLELALELMGETQQNWVQKGLLTHSLPLDSPLVLVCDGFHTWCCMPAWKGLELALELMGETQQIWVQKFLLTGSLPLDSPLLLV